MQFQRPYFISQSIADAAKKNGLRAIIYDSTRNRGGENLSFSIKMKLAIISSSTKRFNMKVLYRSDSIFS